MRVSLNTVKQYTNVNLTVDELVAKINTQLGGVEEVINLGERYEGATIVRVVKCIKHPDADKLSVCEIDAGTGENIQVVCGAPNVHADMLAVWLPPNSTVPASFDEAEPFVLGARQLRGVMSHGMLAAGDELAINSDHDGIVEITDYDLPPAIDSQDLIGKSFAEVFGLDDTLIDIENKMFTHRPDLFGQLGVAREIAGISHKSFESPSWYVEQPNFIEASGLAFEAFNNAPDLVPRFMAVAIQDVEVKPSPLWLQIELMRLGAKSINNIVDVTNYIMLLSAQPVHAYDYDKLRGGQLGVRLAKSGETVRLLNDKVCQLDETDIVIVDGEGPVGLAGIMGGDDSQVSSATKNIVLEVANFDMYAVRRSSMRHGLFTDALTRFNKGQSPLQNPHILQVLMSSIFDVASGKQASLVLDFNNSELQPTVAVSADFINQRLGVSLEESDIKRLLSNVEIAVDDNLNVTPPFWRTDIDLPEDVVEEVGRLYGFDKLPRELPKRSIKPAAKNRLREIKWLCRELLSRAGANEVLTYSFVHENTLLAAGQNPENSYKITNSLSPDLQYYRQTLTPSLLQNIHANVRAGHKKFALFEIGKTHQKSFGLTEESVPVEASDLAFVVASKRSEAGAAFYKARRYLDFLAEALGVQVLVRPILTATAATEPFENKRSGEVVEVASGRVIGVIGEYKAAVSTKLKLPEYIAGFELKLDLLEEFFDKNTSSYRPLSRYPSIERDVCFQVESSIAYQQLVEAVMQTEFVDTYNMTLAPVDIYQTDDAKKNITLRLKFTSQQRTLKAEEVNSAVSSIESIVNQATGARLV